MLVICPIYLCICMVNYNELGRYYPIVLEDNSRFRYIRYNNNSLFLDGGVRDRFEGIDIIGRIVSNNYTSPRLKEGYWYIVFYNLDMRAWMIKYTRGMDLNMFYVINRPYLIRKVEKLDVI